MQCGHSTTQSFYSITLVCTHRGHVNHGKTTLLDYMRKTSVAAKEVGGITQSIGAFVVETNNQERLCVMDTPGHAAFRQMRALGAHLTDIVVLVVSADDSIMPQTLEAIRLIQHANVPLVVAVNKCDLFMHNFKQVKSDLLKEGITDEADGGDTFIVPISAKTGLNVPQLLEAIQFTAEMLGLRADADGAAEAMVVEARVDRGLGALANVIVDRGTLRVGDAVVCGLHHGRVRKLLDSRGADVAVASPSTPVSLIGLDGAPDAGSDLLVVDSLETAARVVEHRQMRARRAELARTAMLERKARASVAQASEEARIAAERAANAARPASAEEAAKAALEQAQLDAQAAASAAAAGGGGGDASKRVKVDDEAVQEAANAAFVDHALEDMKRSATMQTDAKARAAAEEVAEQERYIKMSGKDRRRATRERRADAAKVCIFESLFLNVCIIPSCSPTFAFAIESCAEPDSQRRGGGGGGHGGRATDGGDCGQGRQSRLAQDAARFYQHDSHQRGATQGVSHGHR